MNETDSFHIFFLNDKNMSSKPTFVFKSSWAQNQLVTEKLIQLEQDFWMVDTISPVEHWRDALGFLSLYLHIFMLVFYEKWLN